MNKNDLIVEVAAATGKTQADVKDIINATFETIVKGMVDGERIGILGFGTFEAKERSARVAQNPRTGEKIQVPARRVPKFKAGKPLKEAIK